MATHSSILAWKIPQTEEPGGLQSTGSQRVGYDWATEHVCRGKKTRNPSTRWPASNIDFKLSSVPCCTSTGWQWWILSKISNPTDTWKFICTKVGFTVLKTQTKPNHMNLLPTVSYAVQSPASLIPPVFPVNQTSKFFLGGHHPQLGPRDWALPLAFEVQSLYWTTREVPQFLKKYICYSTFHLLPTLLDSKMAQAVKNLLRVQETGFDPWVRKIPCRGKWLPTPVFLPGEYHGQRSLRGYSS